MKYPFIEDVLKASVVGKTVASGEVKEAIEFARREGENVNEIVAILSHYARVSNPDNRDNFATAEKLLAYCMRLHHWSVFDMADIVLEIECPRDIGRQILRHSSLKVQEFSQRYQDVNVIENAFAIPRLRLQDTKNRQNSIEVPADDERSVAYVAEVTKRIDAAAEAYRNDLAAGVAKETARKLLPEGYTMSRMILKGSVRSWIHYLAVRDDEGVTQWEHVLLARKMRAALAEELAIVFAAANKGGR